MSVHWIDKVLVWLLIFGFLTAFWCWMFVREERRLIEAKTKAAREGVRYW